MLQGRRGGEYCTVYGIHCLDAWFLARGRPMCHDDSEVVLAESAASGSVLGLPAKGSSSASVMNQVGKAVVTIRAGGRLEITAGGGWAAGVQ